MGSYLNRALSKISEIQTVATRVAQEVAEEMGKDAVRYAVAQNSGALEGMLNDEYRTATAQWYAAYSPKKYSRNYSIYNLMSSELGGEFDVGWTFEDTGMTTGPYGSSLFGPVFLGGSHGLKHRSFVPVKSEPVPDIFDSHMKGRVGEIEAMLQPDVQKYYDTHFQSRYEPVLWSSL